MKAEYGYMGKMLFVDLTNGETHEDRTIDFEELKWEYYRAMGLDCTTGVIEQGHIEDLGLRTLLG